jgi:hypothetical protein
VSVLSAATSPVDAERVPSGREGRVLALVSVCYLLAAVAVTWWLWRDPVSGTVAGNPGDADLAAWFFRYDATAIAHARLPALITPALNAPLGVNVMWNQSLLLPGVLLAPVTLLSGAQVSLTVLMTVGFAGSAAAMFAVLRRWGVSITAAVIAGAVYGFSPALLHSAVGHYNLQFAVLLPLIVDAALRLCTGRAGPLRGGLWLGLLASAQLLTAEELLAGTVLAGSLIAVVLAVSRPAAALRRARSTAAGLAVGIGVTLIVCGYPLWVQFFGPLHLHGSAFTKDTYKNDITGFVTPSGLQLFHTASSAAAAAKYQGGIPEYLAYLGWPLLIVLAVIAVRFWRHPAVRATAVTFAVLEVLSLGGTLLAAGRVHQSVFLPWHWLVTLPLLNVALPDRFSIMADGAAAALLAFGVDLARRLPRAGPARWANALVTVGAVLAVLPLVPRPLPSAVAAPLPAGWPASLAALHLPAAARVLVVPIPTPTLTDPMRWQAGTGQPAEMIGGYFTGPGPDGHAYIGGSGITPTGYFLNALWNGHRPADPPSQAQVRAQLSQWGPAAVVAVTGARSKLGQYLIRLLGDPAIRSGNVLAWRRIPLVAYAEPPGAHLTSGTAGGAPQLAQGSVVAGLECLTGTVEVRGVVQRGYPDAALGGQVLPPLGKAGGTPVVGIDEQFRACGADDVGAVAHLAHDRAFRALFLEAQHVVEPDHVGHVGEGGMRRVGDDEGVRLGRLGGGVDLGEQLMEQGDAPAS